MNSCSKPFIHVLAFILCATLPASAAETPGSNRPAPAQAQTLSKKTAWPELGQVVNSVDYESLPLEEVANHLLSAFKGEFDVVVPATIPTVNPSTGTPEPMDVAAIPVRLRLQNVKASEIFNAMNLYFTANGTPLQWELLMNGTRPTAVLRAAAVVLPQPVKAAEPIERSVFFIGDFVDDNRPGKMPWKKLMETLEEINYRTYDKSGPKIAVHPKASLFVVTGEKEQISFIHSLLEALKQKAKLDTEHRTGSTPPGIPLGGETGSGAPK